MSTLYPAMVNSPVTEVAANIDSVVTTITVLNGTALPAAPNIATIGQGDTAETIMYGTRSGNTLSDVVRGFEGTARAWTVGTKVARNFTAYDYDTIRAILANQANFILSVSAPTGKPNLYWYEDLGETPDLGGGGLIIGNASLDGNDDIWFDEDI